MDLHDRPPQRVGVGMETCEAGDIVGDVFHRRLTDDEVGAGREQAVNRSGIADLERHERVLAGKPGPRRVGLGIDPVIPIDDSTAPRRESESVEARATPGVDDPIENFPVDVLAESRELALLFKRLATLRSDAPIFHDVDELRWHGPTDAFAACTERLDNPRLLQRCLAAQKSLDN